MYTNNGFLFVEFPLAINSLTTESRLEVTVYDIDIEMILIHSTEMMYHQTSQ